jgi:hypothetical protein
LYSYERCPRSTSKCWYLLAVKIANIDITPNFSKYIRDLRTGPDTEREFRLFTEELRNTGLGAATLKSLSEISSARISSGRGDPMDVV